MIEPHGGSLIDQTVDEERDEELRSAVANRPKIEIDHHERQDIYNIANGRFSPISGFMLRKDFFSVVEDMRLDDGTVWPLPIVLDVNSKKAAELDLGKKAGLYDKDGSLVGIIEVEEVYKYNKERAADDLFGTTDQSHPGVAKFTNKADFLVGGEIHVFQNPRYNTYDLQPAESRVLFKHNNWSSVVGFQTRNAPHRAHEYIQKSALEHVDGLLIQPKLGEKKSGDYTDKIIMETYDLLIDKYYPDDRVALSVFPSMMRYAGPREAVFDAIVRKNQGCTHFIVGRDHAGVGDFYDGFDSHRIFSAIDDIGINPIFFNYSFYCERCDGMTSEKICPHNDDNRIYPSGSKIRSLIRNNKTPSNRIMRPEVANYINQSNQPFVQ